MNIEIFKRNVQLHKLGISELDNFEKKVYDFLVDNLTELCVYTSDNKPNFLYFGKSEEDIVLFYNSKNQTLYVDYHKIWSFFSGDLSMNYFNVKSLMQWWVGVELGLKPKDTHLDYDCSWLLVGAELGLKPEIS